MVRPMVTDEKANRHQLGVTFMLHRLPDFSAYIWQEWAISINDDRSQRAAMQLHDLVWC